MTPTRERSTPSTSRGNRLSALRRARLVCSRSTFVSTRPHTRIERDQANGSLTHRRRQCPRVREHHPAGSSGWPMLHPHPEGVATVRVRNVATVGGGIALADPNQDPAGNLIAGPRLIVVSIRSPVPARSGG